MSFNSVVRSLAYNERGLWFESNKGDKICCTVTTVLPIKSIIVQEYTDSNFS
jgi:hypothetical protein